MLCYKVIFKVSRALSFGIRFGTHKTLDIYGAACFSPRHFIILFLAKVLGISFGLLCNLHDEASARKTQNLWTLDTQQC